LVKLARLESSPVVRSQFACSAKRFPGEDALAIVAELLGHDEDLNDQHLPLLIWWAIEDKARGSWAQTLQLFSSPGVLRHAIAQRFILERLARWYVEKSVQEHVAAGLGSCARLLRSAPSLEATKAVLTGMDIASVGGKFENSELQGWLVETWPSHSED